MPDYNMLKDQLEGFLDTDPFYVPALSNASALLWEALADINWAGFYIVRGDKLVLGPFQGKPACIHIKRGKGVCGTAWAKDKTQLVPDVHEFPGHIACDSASNSEIVVPLHDGGRNVAGVLDIDSPLFSRFTEEDRAGLEAFAKALEARISW
ncbi:MAG: GAF domain-containing protein [Lachnospiraceae bacterium]|nr:GAF domain-containing protein [Lachnospiraceae bacterium]